MTSAHLPRCSDTTDHPLVLLPVDNDEPKRFVADELWIGRTKEPACKNGSDRQRREDCRSLHRRFVCPRHSCGSNK